MRIIYNNHDAVCMLTIARNYLTRQLEKRVAAGDQRLSWGLGEFYLKTAIGEEIRKKHGEDVYWTLRETGELPDPLDE